jgi:hypothetical protein
MTEEIDRCIEAYEQAKLGKTVDKSFHSCVCSHFYDRNRGIFTILTTKFVFFHE